MKFNNYIQDLPLKNVQIKNFYRKSCMS